MIPAYSAELDFITQKTNIGAEKIDGLSLQTYGMASASFSLQNSLGKIWFFEETFLLADTSIEVVLGMPFLAFSNANFQFGAEKLIWRSYTAAEALLTTSRVEFMDKMEFAKAALYENLETFVVHVSALAIAKPSIHPSRVAQRATL